MLLGDSIKQKLVLFSLGLGIWGLLASPSLSKVDQQLDFKITFRGNQVGEVSAEKLHQGNEIHYEITSQVQVSMIKTFKIDFSLQNYYANQGLEQANLKNSVNDNLRDFSSIQWEGSHYKVMKANDTFKLHKEKALFSTACLYFQEPINRSEVFSENYLEYIPIEKVEADQYKLKLPSGNSNLYYYNERDELEKAVIRDALVQFTFERKNQ